MFHIKYQPLQVRAWALLLENESNFALCVYVRVQDIIEQVVVVQKGRAQSHHALCNYILSHASEAAAAAKQNPENIRPGAAMWC